MTTDDRPRTYAEIVAALPETARNELHKTLAEYLDDEFQYVHEAVEALDLRVSRRRLSWRLTEDSLLMNGADDRALIALAMAALLDDAIDVIVRHKQRDPAPEDA